MIVKQFVKIKIFKMFKYQKNICVTIKKCSNNSKYIHMSRFQILITPYHVN